MSYEQYGCPIRFGSTIFGDKWSLLIVRDLMFKGRFHYGEFLAAGEGISTNILAERLVRLERAGIIHKAQDPNHGKKIIYGLTEKGLDLMPVMFAIVHWSAKYDDKTEVSKEFIEMLRNRPKAVRRELLAVIQKVEVGK